MKNTITIALTLALAIAMLVVPAAAQELPADICTVQSTSHNASIEVTVEQPEQPAVTFPGNDIVHVYAATTDMAAGTDDAVHIYTTTTSMTTETEPELIAYEYDEVIRVYTQSWYADATPEQSTRTAVSATANTATGPLTVSGMADTDYARRVVELVNAEREQAGLAALTADPVLTQAAQQRALELQLELSHTRPDGAQWHTVCAGVNAENIAMGQNSPDSVMHAWMNSQGHRENILWSQLTCIGVSCVEVNGTLYWVQLFGI